MFIGVKDIDSYIAKMEWNTPRLRGLFIYNGITYHDESSFKFEEFFLPEMLKEVMASMKEFRISSDFF